VEPKTNPRKRTPDTEARRSVLPLDFERTFKEAFPPLFRYCVRMTGDPDVAEDVTQEAFARLLVREPDGPPAAIRVWLFRVATHLIRDRYRVSENRRRLLESNPVTPSETGDPERDLDRSTTVAEVRAALERVPERDRTMLLMREEGFGYKEIAESVGVQVSSVGTLLARAQQRFAEAYNARTTGES
jgi:RNA polymerase sigma-70 factor (ECF subfamily)